MAKQPRVWDGSQWQELAVTLPDLSNYSTTTQMNTAISDAFSSAIQSTAKTDTFSTTAVGTWTDVTGLSVSITPKSSSKKILLIASVDIGSTGDSLLTFRFVRNSTPVGVSTVGGSLRANSTSGRYLGSATTGIAMHATLGGVFLDSPATTSSTTYKIQVFQNLAGTLWINRANNDADSTGSYTAISSITAVEF